MSGLLSGPNERYGFKVKYNQFGALVPPYSVDHTEIILVNIFEELSKELFKSQQQHFRMIELGSNQAYYSLMFKSMANYYGKGADIMLVEPNDQHMKRGLEHFHINNLSCASMNFIIGKYEEIKEDLDNSNLPGGSDFLLAHKKDILTLQELMIKYNYPELDILHMDVDHSERAILFTSARLFKEHKIKNIFVSTHRTDLHDACKNFLLDCGYKMRLEIKKMIVGYDSLLVFSVQ